MSTDVLILLGIIVPVIALTILRQKNLGQKYFRLSFLLWLVGVASLGIWVLRRFGLM